MPSISEKERKFLIAQGAYWLSGDLRYRDAEAITEACSSFLDLIYKASGAQRQNRIRHMPQAESFLCALLKASETPTKTLVIGRNQNEYVGTGRLSYAVTVKLFARTIEELGWIERLRGYFPELGKGSKDRDVLKQPLLKWLKKSGLSPDLVYKVRPRTTVTVRDDAEKVRIKPDAKLKKKLEPYEAQVEQINEALEAHSLDILLASAGLKRLNARLRERASKKRDDPAALFLEKKFLRRQFIGRELKKGGRFYGGWWLNIPKGYRSKITIDGRLTCELDYKCQHLELLYALRARGKKPQLQDLYEIPGLPVELRDDLKEIFLMLLNNPSREKAFSALKRRVKRGELLASNELGMEHVVNSFVEFHAPIKRSFFTQAGVWLQAKDSELMTNVLLRVINDLGTVALPVHDSVIIDRDLLEEGSRIMVEEAHKLFNADLRVEKKLPTEWSGDEVEALREEKKMIDGYFLRELAWNKNNKIQSFADVEALVGC
jgi:hypothetical protein